MPIPWLLWVGWVPLSLRRGGRRIDDARLIGAIFDEGWNHRDFSTVASALEAFRFHIRGATHTMRLDDLEAIVGRWHAGFPDLRFDRHATVVDAGRAAVHATLHGTHLGPWNGRAPTGRAITVEHMFFFRLQDGRVTDVWELLDPAEFTRQLDDPAP